MTKNHTHVNMVEFETLLDEHFCVLDFAAAAFRFHTAMRGENLIRFTLHKISFECLGEFSNLKGCQNDCEIGI